MLFKKKSGLKQPFEPVFQRLTPKEFFNIFHSEHIPIIAFILSFAPTKRYGKKVARFMTNKEESKILFEYIDLINENRRNHDPQFIEEIEKTVLEDIGISL
jgi:hypothetical protein